MTLSDQERTQAAATVSPFKAQSDLVDDLPNVIFNMLKELASRSGVPDEVKLGKRKIRQLCDQRSIGPVTLDLEQRLSAELSDYPFEAQYEEGQTANDLDDTVSDIKALLKSYWFDTSPAETDVR
ncbi:hypothetical protein [Halorubellus sp. PRR65]|uniref:hypothetical protein n=1 Tax=Halorubellus sp. PRR65 TaxID=3098148 RepID=UPI002B260FE9|nr:hypothetical protein [Halorubellus sp. PRR65]